MKAKLIELLREASSAQPCKEVIDPIPCVAEYLMQNGVFLIDRDFLAVENIEPIRSAFGLPLNELAELIRAHHCLPELAKGGMLQNDLTPAELDEWQSNNIVKALHCCSANDCARCPLKNYSDDPNVCSATLMLHVADFIICQAQVIKELQKVWPSSVITLSSEES